MDSVVGYADVVAYLCVCWRYINKNNHQLLILDNVLPSCFSVFLLSVYVHVYCTCALVDSHRVNHKELGKHGNKETEIEEMLK